VRATARARINASEVRARPSGAGAPGPGAAARLLSPGSTALTKPDEVSAGDCRFENINAHLFSIEALMERSSWCGFTGGQWSRKFREWPAELAPDRLKCWTALRASSPAASDP